jgi:hypothetical protein
LGGHRANVDDITSKGKVGFRVPLNKMEKVSWLFGWLDTKDDKLNHNSDQKTYAYQSATLPEAFVFIAFVFFLITASFFNF